MSHMGETHRIIITAGALAYLEDIAEHVRASAGDNAARLAERLVVAIDSLATMPVRFKRVGRSFNGEREFMRWSFGLT